MQFKVNDKNEICTLRGFDLINFALNHWLECKVMIPLPPLHSSQICITAWEWFKLYLISKYSNHDRTLWYKSTTFGQLNGSITADYDLKCK